MPSLHIRQRLTRNYVIFMHFSDFVVHIAQFDSIRFLILDLQ
jgi:hypothetical protein